MDFMDLLSRYAKFIVALVGAIAVGVAVFTQGKVQTQDWVATVIAILSALGVRQVTNKKRHSS